VRPVAWVLSLKPLNRFFVFSGLASIVALPLGVVFWFFPIHGQPTVVQTVTGSPGARVQTAINSPGAMQVENLNLVTDRVPGRHLSTEQRDRLARAVSFGQGHRIRIGYPAGDAEAQVYANEFRDDLQVGHQSAAR
jgi:hypothetical protein